MKIRALDYTLRDLREASMMSNVDFVLSVISQSRTTSNTRLRDQWRKMNYQNEPETEHNCITPTVN
ncbi:hypothetical protein SP19_186 [Salmonella phage 19]|nr:hypothetical protein SP19_186 [Salmonella phage 19]